MKYIFFGEPNMLVKEQKKKYYSMELINKPLFRFDDKGEYVTEDERIIDKLKSRFDHRDITEEKEESEKIEIEKYKCKKCGTEFENKGKLLAHSKTCKGDDKNVTK